MFRQNNVVLRERISSFLSHFSVNMLGDSLNTIKSYNKYTQGLWHYNICIKKEHHNMWQQCENLMTSYTNITCCRTTSTYSLLVKRDIAANWSHSVTHTHTCSTTPLDDGSARPTTHNPVPELQHVIRVTEWMQSWQTARTLESGGNQHQRVRQQQSWRMQIYWLEILCW
jgi:hypothetical protein